MTIAIMQRIDADFNLTSSPDPELNQRWFPLAIELGYMPAFEPAHKWVSSQGRMKYINPVYKALLRHGYRGLAYQWFHENVKFYHPIAVSTLKKMLLQSTSPQDEKNLEKHSKTIASGKVTF